MAPRKEACIFLIDVNESMRGKVEKAINAVSSVVQHTIFKGDSSEVGILLFGVPDSMTSNTLHTREADQGDDTQYVGVMELVLLQKPSVETLKRLQAINDIPYGHKGDAIDAMICGITLMHKHTLKKQYRKRICIVTNAASKIEDVNQIEAVVDMYNQDNFNCVFDVIGINFSPPTQDKSIQVLDDLNSCSRIKLQNEWMLASVSHKLQGTVNSDKEILRRNETFRKNVTPRLFNASFKIGKELEIPCQFYIRVSKQSLPSLSMEWGTVKPGRDKEEGKVKVKRKFIHPDHDDEEVDLEQCIKAYPYGSDFVPVSHSDESLMDLPGEEPGLDVIGSVPRSEIHFYMLTGPTHVLHGKTSASTIFASIVQGLRCNNQALIAKFVKSPSALPLLVSIIPDSASENENYSLLIHQMPFSEDIRDVYRPPLDAPSLQPSESQKSAMLSFIDLMMLDETKPLYLNPCRQHICREVVNRALNPKAEIRPLPEFLMKIINPDVKMLHNASEAIRSVELEFPVKRKLDMKVSQDSKKARE